MYLYWCIFACVFAFDRPPEVLVHDGVVVALDLRICNGVFVCLWISIWYLATWGTRPWWGCSGTWWSSSPGRCHSRCSKELTKSALSQSGFAQNWRTGTPGAPSERSSWKKGCLDIVCKNVSKIRTRYKISPSKLRRWASGVFPWLTRGPATWTWAG